jgi:dihydrofolate synthase/folylpolyglutamate synthase
VITSISKEHWQRLGSTLAEITTEKAGILKKNCPAVIGKLPLKAENVVKNKVKELNCPTIWVEEAREINEEKKGERWAIYQGIKYPLKLLGNIQLINSAIAISCVQILQEKGWQISLDAIQEGMRKTSWQGRIEWIKWQNYPILIDGAHNPASAKVLRQYVDTLDKPISWIMGMLSTKDHEDIFKALLREGDELSLVPVPDHSTAEPEKLATLALNNCPNLTQINTYTDVLIALDKAIFNNANQEKLLVICGSLYLLGYVLANKPREALP